MVQIHVQATLHLSITAVQLHLIWNVRGFRTLGSEGCSDMGAGDEEFAAEWEDIGVLRELPAWAGTRGWRGDQRVHIQTKSASLRACLPQPLPTVVRRRARGRAALVCVLMHFIFLSCWTYLCSH